MQLPDLSMVILLYSVFKTLEIPLFWWLLMPVLATVACVVGRSLFKSKFDIGAYIILSAALGYTAYYAAFVITAAVLFPLYDYMPYSANMEPIAILTAFTAVNALIQLIPFKTVLNLKRTRKSRLLYWINLAAMSVLTLFAILFPNTYQFAF